MPEYFDHIHEYTWFKKSTKCHQSIFRYLENVRAWEKFFSHSKLRERWNRILSVYTEILWCKFTCFKVKKDENWEKMHGRSRNKRCAGQLNFSTMNTQWRSEQRWQRRRRRRNGKMWAQFFSTYPNLYIYISIYSSYTYISPTGFLGCHRDSEKRCKAMRFSVWGIVRSRSIVRENVYEFSESLSSEASIINNDELITNKKIHRLIFGSAKKSIAT